MIKEFRNKVLSNTRRRRILLRKGTANIGGSDLVNKWIGTASNVGDTNRTLVKVSKIAENLI